MTQTLCIPRPLAEQIAKMGVKVKTVFYWDKGDGIEDRLEYSPDGEPFLELIPAPTLGELPSVLQEIGKVKGWKGVYTPKAFEKPNDPEEKLEWSYQEAFLYYFSEICRRYAESPEAGWSYLENLLK